jgi:hypothetical protein
MKGLVLRCLLPVVTNINRVIIIYDCILSVVSVGSPGEASVKKQLFQLRKDVIGLRQNKEDAGNPPSHA